MREDGRSWATQAGRRLTLLITNAIKLGGLVVALNEAVGHDQPRALVIGLAAFMMAGAQVSEEAFLGIVQRIFGAHGTHDGSESSDGSRVSSTRGRRP